MIYIELNFNSGWSLENKRFGEFMDENGFTFGKKNEKQLTEREFEVLKLIVMGNSNTEIAQDLVVSVHTAKAHVCSILQKMAVNDRVQAAVKAVRKGIV